MSTVENDDYATGWKKCTVCGLIGPDMVGTPLRCALRQRCDAVKTGKPLSQVANLVPRGPMVRFELDAAELELVDAAVQRWRERLLAEAMTELDERSRLSPRFTLDVGKCSACTQDHVGVAVEFNEQGRHFNCPTNGQRVEVTDG